MAKYVPMVVLVAVLAGVAGAIRINLYGRDGMRRPTWRKKVAVAAMFAAGYWLTLVAGGWVLDRV